MGFLHRGSSNLQPLPLPWSAASTVASASSDELCSNDHSFYLIQLPIATDPKVGEELIAAFHTWLVEAEATGGVATRL